MTESTKYMLIDDFEKLYNKTRSETLSLISSGELNETEISGRLHVAWKNPENHPIPEVTITPVASNNEAPTNFNNDYKTSTGIATFVSFLGWITILISVVLIGMGVYDSMKFRDFSPMALLAIAPMFGIFIAGLFLVISGQITRATLNNTNYSKQMLDIMKRQQ